MCPPSATGGSWDGGSIPQEHPELLIDAFSAHDSAAGSRGTGRSPRWRGRGVEPGYREIKSTLLKEKVTVFKMAAMGATSHHPFG